MKELTITAAPQAVLSNGLYEEWMTDHTGTKDEFLRFLMTPSVDRDLFLDSIIYEVEIVEGLGSVIYSV